MKMNIHKRKQAGLAVAAAFVLSAFMPTLSVAADVVAGDLLKFSDGPGTTGGGEFFVDNLSNGSGIDFITFCIEKNESVNMVNTFKVGAVSTGAVNGGVGGPNPDPISFATAWLYKEFRAGTLASYAHTDTKANSLQKAIWYLEEEYTTTQAVAYAALDAQAQTWVNDASTNGTSLYGVGVINLQTLGGGDAQDQLTMIPEPETYAMLLAGLGLMGFVARRRQRKLVAA